MVRTSDSQPEDRGFEFRRGIFEQDTIKSTARGSHNKQNWLRHPNLSKKIKKTLKYWIFHNILIKILNNNT
jgi:hypothetical protein